MGSLSRALARKGEQKSLEISAEKRVQALEALHEAAFLRKLPPLPASLDGARELVSALPALCEREGWRLRLSVRDCGQTLHWHLVASQARMIADLVAFEQLRFLRALVDLTCPVSATRRPAEPLHLSPLPSLHHHFDWHADESHDDCPLAPFVERLLIASRRAQLRRR